MIKRGQLYHVDWEMIGLERDTQGRTSAVIIPAGSTLQIVKFPCPEDIRLASVDWDGRSVKVFGPDLVHRARHVLKSQVDCVGRG